MCSKTKVASSHYRYFNLTVGLIIIIIISCTSMMGVQQHMMESYQYNYYLTVTLFYILSYEYSQAFSISSEGLNAIYVICLPSCIFCECLTFFYQLFQNLYILLHPYFQIRFLQDSYFQILEFYNNFKHLWSMVAKASWYYHLLPFQNASNLGSILTLLCYLPYHYHQLNFFYTVNTLYYQIYSFLSNYILSVLIPSQYSIVGYVIVSILLILILISSVYNQDKYQGIRYILAYVGSRVFPILRFLLELNVAIASLFMIIDPYFTILFIISVAVNISSTFFLQSYSNYKDYLNCNSFTFVLILKVTLYTNCILNSIGIWYPSNSMVNVIMTFRMILDLIMFVGYFIYGTRMYRHNAPKVLLMLLVVGHFSLTAGQWMDQMFFNLHLYREAYDLLHGVVILVGTLPFAVASYLYTKQQSIDESNEDVKNRCFSFKQREMNYFDDIEEECFVRGMIIDHVKSKCTNPECYSHKEIVYESQKNKMCDIKKLAIHEAAFTKLLMKCWIEGSLEEDKISDKINYAEFLFLNFKNSYRSLHLIEECNNKFQFPLDKLRLIRLKYDILKENKRLNKQLYNDELDVEFIIGSQKKFENIQTLMNDVLKRNLQFWQTVHHNRIDLTQLLQTVEPNFSTLQTINDHWKDLSIYFDLQKKWKFYYAWFTLYIKNQKLKPLLLEFFTNQVKEQDLFTDSYHNESQKNSISRIIFQEASAVIHTNSDANNPTIKKVNRYFSKLFGYEESEILESPLSILMTQSVCKIHPQLFFDWAQSGKSASEPNYKVQKNYAKHKSGCLIGANKYIKQFVTAECELEFVALLKTFRDEEEVIIADQEMGIQGITESLFDKLNLASIWGSHQEIVSLSLILLMPKIIQYSCFKEFLAVDDEHIFGVEKEVKKHYPKLIRKQSTIMIDQNKGSDASSEPPLSNLVQSHINIPKNIKQIVQQIISKGYAGKSLKGKYQLLKQAVLLLQQSEPTLKLKCEVKINMKQFKSAKYLQLHFSTITNLAKSTNKQTIRGSRQEIFPKSGFQHSDFHKFFEGNQNGKVYSLQAANNIFIKQDNNKPLAKLYHISNLSQVFKLFFFFLLISCIVSLISNSFNTFQKYKKIGMQLLTINNLDLSLTYYESNIYDIHFYNKKLLSPALDTVQFYDSAVMRINSTFNNISEFKQQLLLKQTIFDVNLNPQRTYGAVALVGPFATLFTDLVYDESDLFVKLFQVSETVLYYPLNTLSFDQWYAGFLQFYITPGFHTLAGIIKKNISNGFDFVNQSIQKFITLALVVQGIIILGWFVIAIFRITKIVTSFVSIMEVFTQFNQQDIEKIHKYCHFLCTFFTHLNRRDKLQCSDLRQTLENQESATNLGVVPNLSFNNNHFYEGDNNNININKKIKKVERGSLINTVRIQSYSIIILYLLALFGGCFYSTYVIRIKSQSLQILYNQGKTHFKFYNTLTNIQSALQKKAQNSSQYQSIFAQHYANNIKQIMELKTNNSRMIATKQNFAFTSQYNLAYFQNVCTKFSAVLGGNTSEIQNCQLVSDNSLKYGIQSFVYYFTDQALSYLNGTINLTYDQIFKFEEGLKYVNIFMSAIANSWHQQYQQFIRTNMNLILFLSLAVIATFFVIHILLFELFVIKGLNDRYESLRRMYDMYMPDYLIVKEKIIQAKLVVDGIVHK